MTTTTTCSTKGLCKYENPDSWDRCVACINDHKAGRGETGFEPAEEAPEVMPCPSGGDCTLGCYNTSNKYPRTPCYPEPPIAPGRCGSCQYPDDCNFHNSCIKEKTVTTPVTRIETTLAERGSRYGAFINQAVIAQDLADAARRGGEYDGMAADQKEALSVIFNKIARIVNGDPDYSDSWHDIVGYATLVDVRLKGEGK